MWFWGKAPVVSAGAVALFVATQHRVLTSQTTAKKSRLSPNPSRHIPATQQPQPTALPAKMATPAASLFPPSSQALLAPPPLVFSSSSVAPRLVLSPLGRHPLLEEKLLQASSENWLPWHGSLSRLPAT